MENGTIQTLIVEDDVKIAEIQRIFTEKIPGYSVVGIAHTIGEAQEVIPVLSPDLILLDIFFPDGTGLDLLWASRGSQQKTDFILITAAKEVKFFEEGLRGGVIDYILKPLVFSRFASTLEKYRRHREKLGRMTMIDQAQVDGFLRQDTPAAATAELLPKGIDGITLNKIAAVVDRVGPDGINAENAGKRIGVSRTTSRRYLEYLVASGTLEADLSYRAVGRPERIYRKPGG
ncbi:MAG: response regulator [Desulfopila sp.]